MPTPLRPAVLLLGALALGAAGAGSVPPEPPPTLAGTGLYADPATLRLAPSVLFYQPQYPLWTDGAAKARWIFLPPGSAIDVSDPDAWVFPVGTKLWKEFAFGGRRVETRFLWRATANDWVFATYVWNEAGTAAALAPPDGVAGAAEIAPGLRHDVPGRLDCRACHESARVEVLGFTALQLSDDRDPLAPHAETLQPGAVTLAALEERHLLSPARPEWVARPPRIPAATPRERAVLGYLSGNCGACHNADNPAGTTGLLLRQLVGSREGSVPPARATTVGVEGGWLIPGASGHGSLRVAPGDPDGSALVYRMASRRPASQMPPLGTKVPDREALQLVRGWVAEELAPRR